MAEADITQLKNIGPQMALWLGHVGITTPAELAQVSAPMAYQMLRHHFKGVNRLALYALYGALENRHWNSYSAAEKARMTDEASHLLEVRFEA